MKTKSQRLAAIRSQLNEFNKLKAKMILSRDVEKLFGCTRATVANWARAGLLLAVEDETLGYVFDPESVRTFVRPPVGNPTFGNGYHPAKTKPKGSKRLAAKKKSAKKKSAKKKTVKKKKPVAGTDGK